MERKVAGQTRGSGASALGHAEATPTKEVLMRAHFIALSVCVAAHGKKDEAWAHTGTHPAVMAMGAEQPGTDAAHRRAVVIFVISPCD